MLAWPFGHNLEKGKIVENKFKVLSKSEYKKIFPKQEEIEKIFIYLDLFDLEFDPDEITEKTKLKPYKIYKKNTKYLLRSGKEYISEDNSWSTEYSHENVIYADEAIEGFIKTIITPNLNYLKEVLLKSNGKITFVYYTYRSNNIGITLNTEFIELLSELKLKVDFDLYCLHEDEKSES